MLTDYDIQLPFTHTLLLLEKIALAWDLSLGRRVLFDVVAWMRLGACALLFIPMFCLRMSLLPRPAFPLFVYPRRFVRRALLVSLFHAPPPPPPLSLLFRVILRTVSAVVRIASRCG